MASFAVLKTTLSISLLFSSFGLCYGARKVASLYQPPLPLMRYHRGELLEGDLSVSIFWYGEFTAAQKAIVSDFFLSLTPPEEKPLSGSSKHEPAVSDWWSTVAKYIRLAKKKEARVRLSGEVSDESYSLGKSLTRDQISELAARASRRAGAVALVLTDADVGVEGFCISSCGFHASDSEKESAFIWVGNSASKCPGQCAWPFHQPVYGPQAPPLVAPNNDAGVDGMIVNIANLLAGAVTNPFGSGYFQGPAEAPLEAASACAGVYGKRAYPGYAGELLVDPITGASYNAQGVNGRKFLLPSLLDPSSSLCSPLV